MSSARNGFWRSMVLSLAFLSSRSPEWVKVNAVRELSRALGFTERHARNIINAMLSAGWVEPCRVDSKLGIRITELGERVIREVLPFQGASSTAVRETSNGLLERR